MRVLLLAILLVSSKAFGISCDCVVRVHTPMTASHELKPNVLKTYQLEEFETYSVKSQDSCRKSCLNEFEKDMPTDRLHALLLSYSQKLIEEKVLGYNCTGLTTIKFPVRVKAKLGSLGLGNVSDTIEVVTHEELCF